MFMGEISAFCTTEVREEKWDETGQLRCSLKISRKHGVGLDRMSSRVILGRMGGSEPQSFIGPHLFQSSI